MCHFFHFVSDVADDGWRHICIRSLIVPTLTGRISFQIYRKDCARKI
jgi:hypothetical protein